MLTRRSVLAASLGAAVVTATGLRVNSAGSPDLALREIGRSKGIDVGSAFSGIGHSYLLESSPSSSARPQKYRELLAKHCEVLTPEWQLQPSWLKAGANSSYNFYSSDLIAAFCAQNGQKFHGHSLHWYRAPIRWTERATISKP